LDVVAWGDVENGRYDVVERFPEPKPAAGEPRDDLETGFLRPAEADDLGRAAKNRF